MNRSSVIADLRSRIDAVQVKGDRPAIDTPLGVPLPLGEVHEWFPETDLGAALDAGPEEALRRRSGWNSRRSGPSLEDSLRSGVRAIGVSPEHHDTPWIPPLGVLAGLACLALEQDSVDHLIWVGRACWPCPLIFDAWPRVLAASTLLDPPDNPSRLWTIDTVLRSPARLGVIADGRGLTLAHTRRLQLAAGAGGGVCLLVRRACERSSLSAAATRWVVSHCASERGERGLDVTELERPRWSVGAIRNRHRPGMDSRSVVEWDHASGLVRVPAVVERGAGRAEEAIG